MFAQFAHDVKTRFSVRALLGLAAVAVSLPATLLQAQDTRTVIEPTFPATCAALAAQQAVVMGEPASETTLDTTRIQAALTACPSGQAVELTLGGTNNVDNGFLTAPLNIPSGVTLIVDGGVTLFGSRNPADYQSTASGAETCGTVGTVGNGCNPLIQINNGSSSSGSGVMGFGVINGRGGDKILLGGVAQSYSWWDLANQANGNGAQNNPILLNATNASNFTLYKITLANSPMFHVKYKDASGFTVWGVKIGAPYSSRNTDGIVSDDNISNVTINNSYLSDGDDNVAIGANGSGNGVSNVTIENTHTYSGHGLSIGSITSGGVSNVLVQNVAMSGNLSDSNSGGLKIKSADDRGGLVNNVQYQNVCIQNILAPLQFNPFYNTNTGSSYPSYQNIGLHNVTVASIAGGAVELEGYNANFPLGITFDNLNVSGTFSLTPNPQYANISIGPGPVTPASLQTISPATNGSVGVVYSGTTTNPSEAAYACPTTAFPFLDGELYLSTPTLNSQKTLSLPNPASFTLNAIVEVTDSANPTPTSSIQFYEGSNLVGTAALGVNGTLASVTLSGVSSGVHTYTALYPKDSVYAALAFGSVTVNVNTTGTATSMTASPTSASYGTSVALTATVVQAVGTTVPSGSVTFQRGTTVLGTATLNASGVAVLNTTALAVGNSLVAAYFTGSTSFGVSDSSASPVNVSIAKAGTTIFVGAAPATSTFGVTVILTAAVYPVTSGLPTGTVTFMDGSTILGTGILGATTTPNKAEAQLDVSTLGAGSHSISAVYGGDNSFLSSNSTSSAPETVSQASTTTTVGYTPASVAYGSAVTMTGTVNSGQATLATGSITFVDTSTSPSTTLATVAIAAGASAASYTTTSLTTGTHNILAVYSGDTNYTGSSSSPAPLVVTKAASTTTVSATGTSITYGTNDTISTTVSPATTGVPSGSVTFMDGTTVLGTQTLLGSAASISTSTLTGGTHSITVVYRGDSNFTGSTSTALAIIVSVAPTATVLTVPAPITYGNAALLSATVSSTVAGTQTGTITFKDGSTVLGSGTVSGGAASFSAAGLAGGLHSITAVYSGDINFGISASAPATLTVNKASTTSNVSVSPTSISYGSPTVLTASVSPATATGSFTFLDGGVSIGTGTIANGVATLTTSTLTAGSHTITATYSGDGNYSASTTTSSVTVAVAQATATVGLSASPSTIVYLNSTLLTATVPAAATGTVTFVDSVSGNLGTGTVTNGVATFSISTLTVGNHSITAVYSGDTNDTSATSGAITVSVGLVPTTTTVAAQPITLMFGGSTLLTAAVSPVTVTGTVTFSDGATILGTASVSGGAASLTASTLAIGTHSITATYSGDHNDAASTSGVVTVTVNKLSQTITLATLPATVTYGVVPITITASASSSLAVSLAVSGPATLSGNILTITGVGTVTVTATQAGNATYAAAANVVDMIVVMGVPTTTTVSLSAGSAYAGQSVTLTATAGSAAGAPATGTVTFLNGATTLGTGTVTNGVATLTLTNLTVGGYSITASFAASGNYAGSVSPAVTLTVGAPVTLSLSPASLSLAAGGSGTSTLTVSPASGFTGSVTVACSSPVTYVTCTGTTPVSISGTTAGTATVTIEVAATYGELRMPQRGPSAAALASLLPFGALILLPFVRRRRQLLSHKGFRILALLLMAAGLSLAVTGCGGGSSAPSLPPAGSQTVTISATANSTAVTTSLTVSVTN